MAVTRPDHQPVIEACHGDGHIEGRAGGHHAVAGGVGNAVRQQRCNYVHRNGGRQKRYLRV